MLDELREELDEIERQVLTEEICIEYGLDTSFWDYLRSLPEEDRRNMGYE
jgi:hypothetical protein